MGSSISQPMTSQRLRDGEYQTQLHESCASWIDRIEPVLDLRIAEAGVAQKRLFSFSRSQTFEVWCNVRFVNFHTSIASCRLVHFGRVHAAFLPHPRVSKEALQAGAFRSPPWLKGSQHRREGSQISARNLMQHSVWRKNQRTRADSVGFPTRDRLSADASSFGTRLVNSQRWKIRWSIHRRYTDGRIRYQKVEFFPSYSPM